MDKLKEFIKTKNVPNIIFHGSGNINKIVMNFIKELCDYKNVKIIECAFDDIGIKYIKEDLANFLKIKINNGFKIVLFNNAEYLTIDAQSTLRRCIELYNYNTKFFMTVENKNHLLQPIISRFSHIYIPNECKSDIKLKKCAKEIKKNKNMNNFELSEYLYNCGFIGLDLLSLLDIKDQMDVDLLKKNIKDEKTLMLIILNKLNKI
jgi:DNA polymerase III delta prime subunit